VRVEAWIRAATQTVALGVEGAAVLVIALAALEATLRALPLFLRGGPDRSAAMDAVRLRLGRWLAVALEFTLAADILRTAVAPDWDGIGKLAAIATLRTALNFFLQREIAQHEARGGEAPRGEARRSEG
jgi:uncharacterized membrane protein